MGKIFISYRRDDSSYATDGIYEKLVEEYGRKNVFKDVDNIRPGEDFRKVIDIHIKECDIVLAVIGNKWLNVKTDAGKPRLFENNDFVRIELDIGLQRDIPVIPILVDNAKMPKEDDLPEVLKGLSYRNALMVRRSPDTENDMRRLITTLDAMVSPHKDKISKVKIASVLALLSIAGYTQYDKIEQALFPTKVVEPIAIVETVKPQPVVKAPVVKPETVAIIKAPVVKNEKVTKVEPIVKKEVKPSRKAYEPEMVHIKAGSFMMGSNLRDDEKPIHKVNILKDFEIGKYEVTIGQYRAFTKDTKSHYPAYEEEGNKYNIRTGSNKELYSNMCLLDNCPIIGVSWNDAKAYADWLSAKTHKMYSLPSEAQWEYVARAGTDTKWSFGDDKSELRKYAWYDENSFDKGKGNRDYGTHKVGTKKPNRWGIYDMHGNVLEWCSDWYVNSYKGIVSDGSSNEGGEKKYKVLRGGSWLNYSNNSGSSFRYRYDPANRSDIIGFRLQRTLP